MILLSPDPVRILSATAVDDAHGWAEAGAEVERWSGMGSCQETVPVWDGSAADRGGAGPFDPLAHAQCDLYLPTDAAVVAGDIAEAHGVRWLVTRVRTLPDPTSGALDCQVVTCVQYDEA